MLKACKIAFIGVLLAIVPAEKGVLWAETSREQKTDYQAKLIVIDRSAKTITVEIEKRLYLLKLSSDTAVLQKGKKLSQDDLLAGQDVRLQLVETKPGEAHVDSIIVLPATAQSEAAGKKSRK